MHSRYSSWILFAFLDARAAFGSHSASILTAFEQQSYGIRLAFWTFWQHSKYSYWVPTTFELHSRVNTLGMCKNHSMWVRGEFWVFERHSYKKWRSRPNVTRILKMFHSGWFRLILAHFVSVWRGLYSGVAACDSGAFLFYILTNLLVFLCMTSLHYVTQYSIEVWTWFD